jgi:hypothetical protein
MSPLLDFYREIAPDVEGRMLAEIWRWDDQRWEDVHNFIQWLFPLEEPSGFNPQAPLLSRADIAEFRKDEVLRANLQKSFERMLTFLGLTINAEGKVSEGPNFAGRIADVWSGPNHNWLRISRVLGCLRSLGLEMQARALYKWLRQAHDRRRLPIDAVTFGYWTRAATRGRSKC